MRDGTHAVALLVLGLAACVVFAESQSHVLSTSLDGIGFSGPRVQLGPSPKLTHAAASLRLRGGSSAPPAGASPAAAKRVETVEFQVRCEDTQWGERGAFPKTSSWCRTPCFAKDPPHHSCGYWYFARDGELGDASEHELRGDGTSSHSIPYPNPGCTSRHLGVGPSAALGCEKSLCLQWPVWSLKLELEPLSGKVPIEFKFCKVILLPRGCP